MDFKKLIAMLLVVVLLASMICGCEEKREELPSETYLQISETQPEIAVSTTQEVGTEQPEEAKTELECYAAYRKICEERLGTYGAGKLTTVDGDSFWAGMSYLEGLGIVRLIDFDGDGAEELLLIYMEHFSNDYDSWSGSYEVWTFKNGVAEQAILSNDLASGQSGQREFSYYERDEKVYIIKEVDNSYDVENQEYVTELWALNGNRIEVCDTFKAIGNSDVHYYHNDVEVSQTEFEEGPANIWQNKITLTLFPGMAYRPDTIAEAMMDMLQETDEALALLGVATQSTESTRDTETSDLPTDISIVGEWKIDWDQTQKQTGRYGQEMFGTSVSYGNALVLTSDNRIEYFFSFYGGSGTYQFDGESIAVDATSYEPSICSDLQHLSLKMIDGTLYLYMHLNEVLPDYPESDGLYWKLEN